MIFSTSCTLGLEFHARMKENMQMIENKLLQENNSKPL